MKRITVLTILLCLLSTAISFRSLAAFTVPAIENAPANIKPELLRLDEIKAIEKSTLSKTEKKEIRKEVRQIKKSLQHSGTGIYISVGAVIIILLLLIIIL